VSVSAGIGNEPGGGAQKRIDCNKIGLVLAPGRAAHTPCRGKRAEMSKPVGSQAPEGVAPVRASLQVAKKKGCKQQKCSKWKGGKCRCGRE